MIPAVGSRAQALSRRHFLWLVSAAGFGARPDARPAPEDVDGRSALERLHVPVLRLPTTTRNGAKVPIVVEISHPMEPEHGITRLEVVNERDPVPSKGVFHFTPANGQVFLAFQARMDQGVSEVAATAECTLHGRWTSARSVTIPPAAGGCAGSAPPPGTTSATQRVPPR